MTARHNHKEQPSSAIPVCCRTHLKDDPNPGTERCDRPSEENQKEDPDDGEERVASHGESLVLLRFVRSVRVFQFSNRSHDYQFLYSKVYKHLI